MLSARGAMFNLFVIVLCYVGDRHFLFKMATGRGFIFRGWLKVLLTDSHPLLSFLASRSAPIIIRDAGKWSEKPASQRMSVFIVMASYGEQTPSSDVDIIVVFDEKADVSLIGYIRIQYELENIFGRKVDLVEEGSLLPFAVESANRDRELIYERAS